MMIPVTSQIRRPTSSLRKPGIHADSRNKNPTKIYCSSPRDLVKENLQAKLLDLDNDDLHHQDVVTEEILSSLQNKSLLAADCLQMFLSTSWRDRHRKPLIAKIFHTISQESDEDFASHIETQFNNLLNVLTVLGKPDVISDLGMVALLVNLYNIQDLPEEHRAGVEMYLVDIAKAFWPYFRPDKHENLWSDDICDAVCDILYAVGKTLDEKCPINMQHAFNNITIMMFSSNNISSYTLLRFLQLKEARASKWLPTNSAKDYYKSAYLKHPRKSSHCSQEKPDSPKAPKPIIYSSSSDSLRSSSDSDLSSTSLTEDKLCHSPTRSDSPSSIEDDVFKSPIGYRERVEDLASNSHYQVTIKTNTLECGSKNAVVRIKELQSTEDRIVATALDLQDSSHGSTLEGLEMDNSSITNHEERELEVLPSLSSTPVSNEGLHPAYGLIGSESKNLVESPKLCSFPSQKPDCSPTSTWLENSKTTVRPSGGFGLPGQKQSPRFSVPGENDVNGGGFPNANHIFRRTVSEDRDTKSSNNDSERQFISKGGFPKRSQSESSYSGGFSRTSPTLKKALSEGDSGYLSDNKDQFHQQYQRRSSYDKYWKCMLDFPVEPVTDDRDQSSRLYLLSFAVQPASLERPSDLTIPSELQEDKLWLTDIVLPEPITVLDRFGSTS